MSKDAEDKTRLCGKCKQLKIAWKGTMKEYGWCKTFDRRIPGRQPFRKLNKCGQDAK